MKVKAQTQTLSVVLITGIVIAMIGLAYAWGMPLIQKRTSITEFSTAQNFILNLNNKITDIANSGAGVSEIDIPNGFIDVIGYDEVNPDNNSIIMEFTTDQSMITNTSSILIKTGSFGEIGTYGESEPRIITMTGDAFGTGYRMRIKLHYRELDSDIKGYKIALNPISSQGGSKKIKLNFGKNLVIPGNASNNGDLVLTYIDVEIS
jgi:hypothetical protein